MVHSVTYEELFDFWFQPSTKQQWFVPNSQFDDLLRERFYPLYEQGALWPNTPKGVLARILVLDQLPRNLFRGTAQAYATDAEALALCKKALQLGWDKELLPEERLFMGLPLMHSEELADQEIGLQYFAHDPEAQLYAQQHYDVIKRYGRFPKRNQALGRLSTPEELDFLRETTLQW